MEKTVITSRKNPLIRGAAQLKDSAVHRREQGSFLCEGARLCKDAAVSGVTIEHCFYTLRAAEKYRDYLAPVLDRARESYAVEEHVAALLSDTKAGQGIFCVCRWPEGMQAAGDFAPAGPCLVLENLQDPGNLGTVLRTAEAFAVNDVVLLGNCCDPLSPKVLRASMGAVFRVRFLQANDPEALCGALAKQGYVTHAAVPDSTARPVTAIDFAEGRHAVFIGNEGNGLTEKTAHLCDDKITIPMPGRAESLNASAAATVLLWELRRSGRKEADRG